MTQLLTAQNYKKGFLVDDEVIAGVTEMGAGSNSIIFASYISHYLTGETYAYQEFEELNAALDFLATFKRNWVYEAVGCSTKTGASSCSKTGSSSGCGSCGTGACGTC